MAQDTFHVGTLKEVGRVHQQTVIDTYSKVGFAKRHDTKTPVTTIEMLNNRVPPFLKAGALKAIKGIVVSRVLSVRADMPD